MQNIKRYQLEELLARLVLQATQRLDIQSAKMRILECIQELQWQDHPLHLQLIRQDLSSMITQLHQRAHCCCLKRLQIKFDEGMREQETRG
jgi:hypothetical protein